MPFPRFAVKSVFEKNTCTLSASQGTSDFEVTCIQSCQLFPKKPDEKNYFSQNAKRIPKILRVANYVTFGKFELTALATFAAS